MKEITPVMAGTDPYSWTSLGKDREAPETGGRGETRGIREGGQERAK